MEWSILIIAAACAVTAIVVAFLVDRDSAKQRQQILSTPPDQPVLADQAKPVYLRPGDVHPVRPDLTPDQRDNITARLDGVTPLPVGWPSSDFITDPVTKRAVVEAPVVLAAGAVTRIADIAPLIRSAATEGTGLVIVAGQITPDVMATLSLNAAAGRLSCSCLVTDDLAAVAAQTHATVLEASDVAAGYFPSTALGHCDLWVSGDKQTWIVPLEDNQDPQVND